MAETVNIQSMRERVAKACRVLGKLQLTTSMRGHISARLPESDTLLIRARGPGEAGVRFTSAEDVITIDLDGNKLDGRDDQEPPMEFFIHTWLYRTRPEIHAVLHAHPSTVVLFTICNKPLEPLFGAYDPSCLRLLSQGISTYPRSVLISNNDLGREFAEAANHGQACLMRGHGITTCGSSVEETTLTAIKLNELADINYRANLLGNAEPIPPDELASFTPSKTGTDPYDAPLWRYYCRLLGEDS
ncbi:MAG: hypothetical protein GEU95_14715 [Rhizobiales bacterium]|nr:hypothetical protein [Hyphomicrobiales bacterium]